MLSSKCKKNSMCRLRPYQMRIANDANEVLNRKGFVYLAMQVRTGKTLTALKTCELFGAKKVLFITKIKVKIIEVNVNENSIYGLFSYYLC